MSESYYYLFEDKEIAPVNESRDAMQFSVSVELPVAMPTHFVATVTYPDGTSRDCTEREVEILSRHGSPQELALATLTAEMNGVDRAEKVSDK